MRKSTLKAQAHTPANTRRRWIGYRKADGEAEVEALQAAPPAVWG